MFVTCSAYALANSAKRSHAYAYHTFPAIHLADASYTMYDPTANSTVNETVAYILQDYITEFAVLGAPDSYPNNNFTVRVYHYNSELVFINGAGVGVAKDPISNERCQWSEKALAIELLISARCITKGRSSRNWIPRFRHIVSLLS